MDPDDSILEPPPSTFNYVLSFLLVGVAWGFTTPFIRRAAADFNARQEAQQAQSRPGTQEGVQLLSRRGSAEGSRQGKKDDNEVEVEHEEDENEDEDEDSAPPPAVTSKTTTRAQPAWMKSKSQSNSPTTSWLKTKLTTLLWTVFNLLRTPAYSVPLILNLTGSIWFFLLVGKHELSLTVPLANSSAFLFTVLGEWYVERKTLAKETWLGMGLVLGGIGLCVQSKQ